MPTKVNVTGNRNLKKSSRKSSRKSSKANKRDLDFTSVLNEDMNMPTGNTLGGINPMMMNGMPQMPQMGMPMGGDMMGMPMGGDMMGMPMGPSMGMPIGAPMPYDNGMMMGRGEENNVDPLHVQYMVPHNQNLNINNYGISQDQLLNGSEQATGLSQRFNGVQAPMQQAPIQHAQMQAPTDFSMHQAVNEQ
jgi:hypothetical protein